MKSTSFPDLWLECINIGLQIGLQGTTLGFECINTGLVIVPERINIGLVSSDLTPLALDDQPS